MKEGMSEVERVRGKGKVRKEGRERGNEEERK